MFGIKVEADLDGHMLYIVNEDAPGFIGRIGTALGEAGLNIGTFHLGRRGAGGEAVLLLSLDSPLPEPLLWQLCQLPGEIGRASCRDRVCQYVSISVVAVSLKKESSRNNKTYARFDSPTS